jgi:hypothetical protein
MTENQTPVCHWCGAEQALELADFDVKVANPQVDFDHSIYQCSLCRKLTAEARWGREEFAYRALEYSRAFRRPVYVLVYEVACAWCGRSDLVEPAEINATVGNPASQRHHYDIYACHACDRHTAVSYLGQVVAYPATQDERYPSMFYLEVGEP